MPVKKENDVILAVLKLSRAMRRCPPPQEEHPFPPAVSRMLACISENPRMSSRDLCEILDLRPSSLSEILARAEKEGWITRTVDEEDRRIQRVSLSPKGTAYIEEAENAREKDAARKTACFTEEEKARFCALCDKLSSHIESLASDLPRASFRPDDSPEIPERPEDFPGDRPERGPEKNGHPPRRRLPPTGRIRC